MTDERLQDNDEISLKELIQKIQDWLAYLKTQWWKITIAGLLGGVIGYLYAFVQPVTYTAKTTFVVEDAKSSGGLSGLASLAGQFGVDLGSNAGGGLIAGENTLLYFKSESLIREVLISPWDNNNSFADYYLNVGGHYKKWEKKSDLQIFKIPIYKPGVTYSRIQDSVLQFIIKRIIKSELLVNKVDKKAGFIDLSTTMIDEQLSKRFCDQLLEAAIERYVGLKTERQKKTVANLQARADSIGSLLNDKTVSSARLQTNSSTMDVNPLYKTSSTITTELTNRDKMMLSTIYGEVVKNLELSKFTLSQETPAIQVVNESLYPLLKNKRSRFLNAVICCLIFISLTAVYFFAKKWYKKEVLSC